VRILVGTKSDLRTDPDMVSHMNEKGKKYITLEQAQEVQRKIKAVRYIETSAKTGNNVKECMSEAVMAVINNENVKPYKRKKTGTCLML
jgi:Ras family protein A